MGAEHKRRGGSGEEQGGRVKGKSTDTRRVVDLGEGR